MYSLAVLGALSSTNVGLRTVQLRIIIKVNWEWFETIEAASQFCCVPWLGLGLGFLGLARRC